MTNHHHVDYADSPATATAPNLILHLGLGAFHRAHQAVYLQRLIDSGDATWALAGGNLRDDVPMLMDALHRQHGRYTLETISPQSEYRYQSIRAITRIIPYDEQLSGLVATGADARTKIISFTVTEAGYYLTDNDQLDYDFADLTDDIRRVRDGLMGRTLYGALVGILRARMAHGSGAVTLLNCDNLRHNGRRFRQGFLQFIKQIGDAVLQSWVEANTRCPNCMVDRITPRPTDEVGERVRATFGMVDPAALMAEDFIQWVVEDDFIASRPAWETVGVEMVASVTPYEEAKIRVLNASHSCIAWAGTLRGYLYIHEGVQDAAVQQLAYDYISHDVLPCLQPSPVDLAAYRDTVLQRFSNAAICDTNQRVAMDAYAKIPGYIVPTIRDCFDAGRSCADALLLPALFLVFLQRWHEGKLPYAYQDQSMDAAAAHAMCAADDAVAVFCADAKLWGQLANQPRLIASMRTAYLRAQQFASGQ